MARLRVFLFGMFQAKKRDGVVDGLEARKVQELFCYLLLNRQNAQAREQLAEVLWAGTDGRQQRKYLRKALWQLQAALTPLEQHEPANFLHIDTDWIQINPQADLLLDVLLFEQAYNQVQALPGRQLDPTLAQLLCWATTLYHGPLLAGNWYADWCIYHRERLQFLYLAMLDKLMDFHENQGTYELGIYYGLSALKAEPARETTHRRIMRMHYLRGHRTEALRQYERCLTTLQQELGVTPTPQTMALVEKIRLGQLLDELPHRPVFTLPQENGGQLPALLARLQSLEANLITFQRQVRQEITTLEEQLDNPDRPS